MDVQQGDLLVEIDSRPYKLELEKAQAQQALAEARLKQAAADYERAKRLLDQKAISKEELEKLAAARVEAEAALKVAQVEVERAKLQLEFTRVTAPMSGKVDRRPVTEGTIVIGDTTLLTAILVLDPLHVYFDVDERDFLRIRQLLRDQKQDAKLPVSLGLAGDKEFAHQGVVDFVDLKVDPNTGTVRVRAVFPNKDGKFLPGMFVKVRLPLGEPRKGLLVVEDAIGTDQGKKYVLIVNDKNVVERRDVKLGPQIDGLRVIEDGLKPKEWVVVSGLKDLKPGDTVEPQRKEMPQRPASKEKPNQTEKLKKKFPSGVEYRITYDLAGALPEK
jgi:RND family efflux transporter MFP subunit